MPVRFRLLGVIEAEVDGTLVELGHARQRGVLAALPADANHPVSADQLAEDVVIAHGSGGYVVRVAPEAIELHRFRTLVADARANQAMAGFDEALAKTGAAPRVVAAIAGRRECTAGRGYGYAAPSAARADVACEATACLVEVWHDVEAAMQEQDFPTRFPRLATALQTRLTAGYSDGRERAVAAAWPAAAHRTAVQNFKDRPGSARKVAPPSLL